jgi:hypothetical protein
VPLFWSQQPTPLSPKPGARRPEPSVQEGWPEASVRAARAGEGSNSVRCSPTLYPHPPPPTPHPPPPTPDIIIQQYDPLYAATARHFADLGARYGHPVVVLNLLRAKERR